ncbi:MAG: hypothetical protein ACK4I8_09765 [Armatimonadota bacterium]
MKETNWRIGRSTFRKKPRKSEGTNSSLTEKQPSGIKPDAIVIFVNYQCSVGAHPDGRDEGRKTRENSRRA